VLVATSSCIATTELPIGSGTNVTAVTVAGGTVYVGYAVGSNFAVCAASTLSAVGPLGPCAQATIAPLNGTVTSGTINASSV
jgi:hypothetical protein